ncbi:hypothetical protein OJ996_21595 [Luteolibacter sp. GHJ8]|uniref:Uncharacterized protein n=1 Tax=Luteolibacter rhizosphaerae TaxID=2989719 RepID=A0ABT3G9P7_9BACT|nr:hypothetical protein [Luteolibacter rhizosphaerae]MCW1916199.1 hypothetical protein [Luteolibacter rhizosphaerae]
MFLVYIHILACLTLTGAAAYRIARVGTAPTAHRFLAPYAVAAFMLGIVITYVTAMELFVVSYSGASPVPPGTPTPPPWLPYLLLVAPLLPGFTIVPAVGSRPLPVALLGLLAVLPSLIFYFNIFMVR